MDVVRYDTVLTEDQLNSNDIFRPNGRHKAKAFRYIKEALKKVRSQFDKWWLNGNGSTLQHSFNMHSIPSGNGAKNYVIPYEFAWIEFKGFFRHTFKLPQRTEPFFEAKKLIHWLKVDI